MQNSLSSGLSCRKKLRYLLKLSPLGLFTSDNEILHALQGGSEKECGQKDQENRAQLVAMHRIGHVGPHPRLPSVAEVAVRSPRAVLGVVLGQAAAAVVGREIIGGRRHDG